MHKSLVLALLLCCGGALAEETSTRAACGFLFEGVFTIFEAKTTTHYVRPVRRGLADQLF
jgi:hypothetical protein